MAWDTVKESLLAELAQRIDKRAEVADRQSLHNLSASFYSRFPAQDIRDRSVEKQYGCLYGLLRFMREWSDTDPKIRIFNPEIQNHGWESKYTTLVILCRGIPFTMASVRGELNRRNVRIHTIASSNLAVERDKNGELKGVLHGDNGDHASDPGEALLFFEIGRHSNPAELVELRETLAAILGEVALVVDDFPAICGRLQQAATDISQSACVAQDYREEAIAFLGWLERNHMTLLGYEYLSVKHSGGNVTIKEDKKASLGLLRKRKTRGVLDLQFDIEHLPLEQLHGKQLSFSKSRSRSRVHRLTYPDYVEVKVFDAEGQVVAGD